MRRALLASLLLAAAPAAADDVWTTPFPGVRLLRRTTARPTVTWVAVVDSCAPGVRFRVTAPDQGMRTTSSFGRAVGAQLAVNGDFFDHDFGLNVGDGRRWPQPDTDHSGNFSVGPNRIELTPDQVVLPGPYPWVTEQLGGRWTLLDDGDARRGIDDNGPASGGFVCAPGLRHPRTAVGLSRDRRTVFLLVADGRSSASVGLTCDEMIDLFVELGAHDAMGLDGGGSSTLWTSAAGVVNHPSDGTERVVGDHLAVFATGSGPAPHCGRRDVVVEPASSQPVPGAALPSVTALTAPSRFRPATPTRLFDTRSPETSARLARSDGSAAGPLSIASSGSYRDWAAAGVASDATAAWLNVTAVANTSGGYVVVFPHGRPRPGTSNVNYDPSRIVANAVPVAFGDGAQVDFAAHTAVDVVADLAGSFGPTGAGLSPVAPTRVLDTRTPVAPLRGGVPREVDVRAPAGATGVVATVAVVAGSSPGFLTAAPCGAPTPPTSNVNFAAGDVVANAVASGLGGGRLCLTSSVDADVVVDVTGYLSPSGPLSYVALFPQRLLDTRTSDTPYAGRVAAGQVLTLPVQRLPGMPAGVGAVAANVTVTDAESPGFLTAFPCGAGAPTASSLNYPAARAVGALTVTAVGGGDLCVVSSARAHVLVDLMGVWVTAPPPTPDAGVDAGVDAVADVARDAVAEAGAMDAARDAAADASVDARDDVAAEDVGGDAMEDTGLREASPVGCGCRASGGARESGGAWLLAFAALAARRRRVAASRGTA
ncbi:MAG: phosphodiester glycosidase family protein [Polyangiales bacterium]